MDERDRKVRRVPKNRKIVFRWFKFQEIPEIIDNDDPWRIWIYFKFHNRLWSWSKDCFSQIGGKICRGNIYKKSQNFYITTRIDIDDVFFTIQQHPTILMIIRYSIGRLKKITIIFPEKTIEMSEDQEDILLIINEET